MPFSYPTLPCGSSLPLERNTRSMVHYESTLAPRMLRSQQECRAFVHCTSQSNVSLSSLRFGLVDRHRAI